ncbi:MAG: PAAR domain-containing protein [Campylobacterales bacterium]|nr:PAAR domain-containing protein [Campylobacterales bacterium]
MPPAARITDLHTCPLATAALPSPIPHLGGPIIGPGIPTVLIGKLPASVVGDICTCVGPQDTIIQGSSRVFISGKPAARMGDATAHGGQIRTGCFTVMIG